jgi:hypothetical protein
MAYTETKVTGYGTRVKNSCAGIGGGILMFILGTVLLWWNEGRAVKTTDMLNEAQEVCIDMPNPSKVDPAFDGELVCASALATTEDELTDDKFGFSEKVIGLSRRVEYYQWYEDKQTKKEDKLGGKEVETTTYTYSKKWKSSPVNSQDFHDPAYQNRNFTLQEFENSNIWAQNVSFGAYTLNESLIKSITSREAVVLNLDKQVLASYDKACRDVIATVTGKSTVSQPATNEAAEEAVADSMKTVVSDSIPQENKIDLEYVHQQGNVLYFGRTPDAPQVGDVRITFEKIVPAKVTVIAKVSDKTFVPYKAKNGKTFETLYMGKKTSEEIFESEHSSNTMWTWALRILGALLVIGGLKGIFGFIETILKVVPFVSNIVGFGVGIICTILGIVWSIIVIAIAWIFYRPLLGIALLVIAGLLIWIFAFKGKAKLQELASKAKNKVSEAKAPAPENA